MKKRSKNKTMFQITHYQILVSGEIQENITISQIWTINGKNELENLRTILYNQYALQYKGIPIEIVFIYKTSN